MSAFRPESYAEALAIAQSRPRKPRTPLKPSGRIKIRHKLTAARTRLVKKKAKKRKPTTGQLKKRVWREFSIFIRTRGADADGINSCFTCDERKHWKELEAGHLVPGRNNAVLFSEIGVNSQCRRCNGHFRGNVIVYYPKMVRLHGQAAVDALVAARDVTHKWLAGELQSLLERYQALNAANPLVSEPRGGG